MPGERTTISATKTKKAIQSEIQKASCFNVRGYQNSARAELIRAVEKAEAEAQKEEEVINQANISEEDREFVRSQLREIVKRIKMKYGLNIPVKKVFSVECWKFRFSLWSYVSA